MLVLQRNLLQHSIWARHDGLLQQWTRRSGSPLNTDGDRLLRVRAAATRTGANSSGVATRAILVVATSLFCILQCASSGDNLSTALRDSRKLAGN